MTSALVLQAYEPNDVKPGWVAFFIVMALCVATYLLWRSMNTQLGKIKAPTRAEVRKAAADSAAGSQPRQFPAESDDPPPAPPER